MRLNVAALWLSCCIPIAVSAQSGRQEKTFTLPAGVSPAGASLAQGASVSREGDLVAAICSDRVVRRSDRRRRERRRVGETQRQADAILRSQSACRRIAQLMGMLKTAHRVTPTCNSANTFTSTHCTPREWWTASLIVANLKDPRNVVPLWPCSAGRHRALFRWSRGCHALAGLRRSHHYRQAQHRDRIVFPWSQLPPD